MSKKKALNKKKIVLLIVILVFAIMFVISTVKILSYLKDNKQNKQIQKITSEAITVNPDVSDLYQVDFDRLKEINADTVAYLKVNNTNIDYIVVKSTDNKYYLNHNFYKNSNVSGWIFADYHNKFDGKDKNIIIYGHNTHDGSMFGTLSNVLEQSWQSNQENLIITLVTPDNTYNYQVFSTYMIEAEDYYISTSFDTSKDFNNFVNILASRSNYDYNVSLDETSGILTLSSCNINGTKRVVLHAKLLENKKDE